MWYVYFLQLSNGDIYVGSTNDLRRRLRSHQRGQAIPSRAHFSSQTMGRRVSLASFFTVSSIGWRSRRIVLTMSGARKPSRGIRVK
ncbi:MAG: GIY-YIG nuclease family protein [Proteobacteria bacterium]|nr:GIY-YIG nuclease family protein [Pseudomonadota bacterium]